MYDLRITDVKNTIWIIIVLLTFCSFALEKLNFCHQCQYLCVWALMKLISHCFQMDSPVSWKIMTIIIFIPVLIYNLQFPSLAAKTGRSFLGIGFPYQLPYVFAQSLPSPKNPKFLFNITSPSGSWPVFLSLFPYGVQAVPIRKQKSEDYHKYV